MFPQYRVVKKQGNFCATVMHQYSSYKAHITWFWFWYHNKQRQQEKNDGITVHALLWRHCLSCFFVSSELIHSIFSLYQVLYVFNIIYHQPLLWWPRRSRWSGNSSLLYGTLPVIAGTSHSAADQTTRSPGIRPSKRGKRAGVCPRLRKQPFKPSLSLSNTVPSKMDMLHAKCWEERSYKEAGIITLMET